MTPTSGSQLLSELESQSSFIMRAVERALVAAQVRAGQRDPDRLADAVFYLRHPALRGRRIRADEPQLAAEWRALRRDLVAPALAGAAPAAAAPAPRAAPPPPPAARRGDVGWALQIARTPVPGMAGTTVRDLLERWRAVLAPEIPLACLLAFIRFESGGRFDDATHGAPRNGYTQPSFYELGLFQTPAGLHGACTGPSAATCQNAPPGLERPGDPSTWARLCRSIGADPGDWKNPVTQVRVGLLDLHGTAEGLRREYRDLFPARGGDWDLRMAVLLPFARGGGFARAFLRAFRGELARLPEERRWDFLRGKSVRGWAFDAKNVDEKMALAAQVAAALARSP